MKPTNKPVVGFYGLSGCAGCLLTVLYEKCFKQLIELVDIKAFPFIKENDYDGDFDYVFVEGTVCFDEDIVVLNELRKRSKNLVALGACACVGCVPTIKNFMDGEKVMGAVYPTYNHLKAENPTPLDAHVKVDYYLPQCPPDKKEISDFIECIATGREFKLNSDPVCFECRKKGIVCLLTLGKICLGPITRGGCGALCPFNSVMCYGCRGPCDDANMIAFIDMLKKMGYDDVSIHDKMNTFAGLQFREKEKEASKWLEK